MAGVSHEQRGVACAVLENAACGGVAAFFFFFLTQAVFCFLSRHARGTNLAPVASYVVVPGIIVSLEIAL